MNLTRLQVDSNNISPPLPYVNHKFTMVYLFRNGIFHRYILRERTDCWLL